MTMGLKGLKALFTVVTALAALLLLSGTALAQDPTQEPAAAACNDAVDNDSDVDVDYPNDPGCESLADDSEDSEGASVADGLCNDGTDNDGDALIDYPNDPGCQSLRDDSEGASEAVDVPAPRPPDRATSVGGSVSIRFDPRYGFRGEVRSSRALCERKRSVVLKYVDGGSDTVLGDDAASAAGTWGVPVFRPGARHYAIAPRKVVKTGSGEQIVCKATRSKVVGI